MKAILLGSGFSSFSAHFEILRSIPYSTFLNFEYQSLAGHERCLYLARENEEEFLILSGRLHSYEGFTAEQLFAVLEYVISNYSISSWVITSASGGLSERIAAGQWCVLSGMICLPQSKLFFSIAPQVFDLRLTEQHQLPSVVYAFQQGPSLGTASEYRMLHRLGADLVGMSMYPEKLFLDNHRQQASYLSLPVCNYYPLDNIVEPTHEAVIEIGKMAVPKLVNLFKAHLKVQL